MPGLSARSVLALVASFAGDVNESVAPEELGHMLFRPAGHDGTVVSVVAELVFLVFAGELNVVPPNPFSGMNFANRDFDVEVFACHNLFPPAGPIPRRPAGEPFPGRTSSILDKRKTFVKMLF